MENQALDVLEHDAMDVLEHNVMDVLEHDAKDVIEEYNKDVMEPGYNEDFIPTAGGVWVRVWGYYITLFGSPLSLCSEAGKAMNRYQRIASDLGLITL